MASRKTKATRQKRVTKTEKVKSATLSNRTWIKATFGQSTLAIYEKIESEEPTLSTPAKLQIALDEARLSSPKIANLNKGVRFNSGSEFRDVATSSKEAPPTITNTWIRKHLGSSILNVFKQTVSEHPDLSKEDQLALAIDRARKQS